MPDTALVVSLPAGTAPTVPVGHLVTETEAKIIVGPWRAVTNELATPVPAVAGNDQGWLSVDAYEERLAQLVAENDARGGVTWEPDTPGQAAERAEITEALLDVQIAVITHDEA